MRVNGLRMNNTAVITIVTSVFVVVANCFLSLLRTAVIIVTYCEHSASSCDKWPKTWWTTSSIIIIIIIITTTITTVREEDLVQAIIIIIIIIMTTPTDCEQSTCGRWTR